MIRWLEQRSPWVCRRCGEEYFGLAPPAERTCDGCLPAAGEISTRDRLAAAGVPAAYLHCSRAGWDEAATRWPASLRTWQGDSNVVLWGADTGAGKTHLATALLAERLEAGEAGLWLDVPELLDRLRQREEGLMDRATGAELLVLDELDGEPWSAWAVGRLARLLRQRFNQRSPTIVTCRQRLSQALGVGERGLTSRFLERAVVVHVAGDDWRLRRQA